MAKCKFCGAEVAIGARCTYCGRGKYYIVQKGDNLWNIAKRFYGAGAEYYRIVRKNHLQDPNHIEVGQKLYL